MQDGGGKGHQLYHFTQNMHGVIRRSKPRIVLHFIAPEICKDRPETCQKVSQTGEAHVIFEDAGEVIGTGDVK